MSEKTGHDDLGYHVHVHDDGTVYAHVHGDELMHQRDEAIVRVREEGAPHVHDAGMPHGHDGTHPHIHKNKKAVHDRLAKANGHLSSVIRMIDDDRDCAEVLVQLAAVRSAINNAGKILLEDHITECITEAIRNNDQNEIEKLNRAIDQFMK
ncbi:MAG: metal-sensing transcriptional repressor [Oscillospiraceae bacterium]|jgi:DNA-binding FrmR family transcriptional regulator